MVFIPAWVSNVLFLITIYISGYQHVRLKRRNPVTNLQFVMIAFALLMIIFGAFYGHENAWLSVGFFTLAVACLGLMIRQQRTLPPTRRFENL
jgi:uncharacterized membrane protein